MDKAKRLSATALAFLALLIVSFILVDKSEASSRIRAGGCDVYQTAVLDPIALAHHVHHFTMGRVVSNSDTGSDLKARAITSCNEKWATSGAWYPKPKTFQSEKITAYYRDPGNIKVNPVPTDLRMLNAEVVYKGRLTTVHFGNCLQMNSARTAPVLDSPDHKSHVEDKNSKPCDSSHPYRIPRISYLIHWSKSLSASTPVSAGDGLYTAGSFHADYLAAVQDEFNTQTSKGPALIDLCLNNVPLSKDVASPRCGLGP